MLREKNDHLRQERLQRANADQISALSVLALNLLKGEHPYASLHQKAVTTFCHYVTHVG